MRGVCMTSFGCLLEEQVNIFGQILHEFRKGIAFPKGYQAVSVCSVRINIHKKVSMKHW